MHRNNERLFQFLLWTILLTACQAMLCYNYRDSTAGTIKVKNEKFLIAVAIDKCSACMKIATGVDFADVNVERYCVRPEHKRNCSTICNNPSLYCNTIICQCNCCYEDYCNSSNRNLDPTFHLTLTISLLLLTREIFLKVSFS